MDIEALIDSVDIVEYISQFVDLTQKGDEWWGLSCFKEEKTPSFSVRKSPPLFYDYSSGAGGNLFTFVKRFNHCGGKEAVEIIKKYAGYEGELSHKDASLAATLDCKRFARKSTVEKKQKGVFLPDDCMIRYEKTPEKLDFWRREGISDASLDKFEVCYDGFSDRIVYPIRNSEGKIVNIGGRTLDPDWKERKLRKYTYFYSWGTLDLIYGLYENREAIKKAGEIILFEGCKSTLLADTWGIHNTGAILTSHLNPHQLKLLAGLGCQVVFALDKDVNIKDDKNIVKLKRYVNVEYICDRNGLLDAKDSPVDKGVETFRRLYEQRVIYK